MVWAREAIRSEPVYNEGIASKAPWEEEGYGDRGETM